MDFSLLDGEPTPACPALRWQPSSTAPNNR